MGCIIFFTSLHDGLLYYTINAIQSFHGLLIVKIQTALSLFYFVPKERNISVKLAPLVENPELRFELNGTYRLTCRPFTLLLDESNLHSIQTALSLYPILCLRKMNITVKQARLHSFNSRQFTCSVNFGRGGLSQTKQLPSCLAALCLRAIFKQR